jgi:hypothetical protein
LPADAPRRVLPSGISGIVCAARQRKSQAGLLHYGLGIFGLGLPVYRASRPVIRHRRKRDGVSTATGRPPWLAARVSTGAPRSRSTMRAHACGPGSKRRFLRSRDVATRNTMANQAGDGCAAGMIGTQDLSQEDPQRDQRRKDAVQPPADRGQRLLNDLFREDISERQMAVLKKLTPKNAHLFTKRTLVKIPHSGGLLGGDGIIARYHLHMRGPVCPCRFHLSPNYSRPRRKAAGGGLPAHLLRICGRSRPRRHTAPFPPSRGGTATGCPTGQPDGWGTASGRGARRRSHTR